MMQQTNLKDEYVMAAEWDKATALQVNPFNFSCFKSDKAAALQVNP